MIDYMIKAIALDSTIIAIAATTTQMVHESQRIHHLSPVAAAALGRALTGAAMMSYSLKNEKDTLTLQIKGDGPLGGIVVVADSNANIRGYVHNPLISLPLSQEGMLDVSRAVGKNGYLNVIKDLGLKKPYIGFVELVSGEIAEDITFYLSNSEQVSSSVFLEVIADKDEAILCAGGLLIQLLPGATEETGDFLDRKIKLWPLIYTMLAEGCSPEEILSFVFKDRDLKVIEKREVKYQCNCSRERMARNLLSIGKNDLIEVFEKEVHAELTCYFCNKHYLFLREEFEKYF